MKIYIRFMFNSKQYRIQRFSKVALSGSSILFLLEILKFGWLVPTLPGIFLKIWFLLYLAATWRSGSNYTWQLLEDLVPTIPGSYLKIWFTINISNPRHFLQLFPHTVQCDRQVHGDADSGQNSLEMKKYFEKTE